MPERVAFDVRFADSIPDNIEERIVYVSTLWGTAKHLCACGCGSLVVTPITPDDWKFAYDGHSISLDPSIGNWSFECQSHYWIDRGEVVWARKWTQDEIRRVRNEERTKWKERRGESLSNHANESVVSTTGGAGRKNPIGQCLQKLLTWIRSQFRWSE